MKKLNELKNGKTKEEMDNEAIKVIQQLGRNAAAWRDKMANDPDILAMREEYAIRKANGEFPDEIA